MDQTPSNFRKKKFTEEDLEKMFQHRFTDQDDKYVETVNRKYDPPPCVHNWTTKPKRSFDYSKNLGKDGNRVFFGGRRDRRDNPRDYGRDRQENFSRDHRQRERDDYRRNRGRESHRRDRSRDRKEGSPS